MIRILKSAGIGFLLALGAGAGAFLFGAETAVVESYLAPGVYMLDYVAPLSFNLAYWLHPDGGAPAAVGVVLICALVFWTVVFGGAVYWRARVVARRSGRKAVSIS